MEEMAYCSFSGGEEYRDHFQPGTNREVARCVETTLPQTTTDHLHDIRPNDFVIIYNPRRKGWTDRRDTNASRNKRWIDDIALHDTLACDQCYSSVFHEQLVCCGKCGNGLGHEFLYDGLKEGQSRFCIFSSSLTFIPKEGVNQQRSEQ
ncbi:methionine-R-sulfoxide reductase B1-A-like [Gouania willdenowi]|uniref:methionine-R-sulfoxide reductase B1-A-like n=1 Tax=Gouania willdenowi TaxID=441366 RepID=UPI0010560C45|nr:methionine-R-sulfoxide reductase B1-A-like [Gouania willdenowi]